MMRNVQCRVYVGPGLPVKLGVSAFLRRSWCVQAPDMRSIAGEGNHLQMECCICLPVIPDAVGALLASLVDFGELRQVFFGDVSDRLTKVSAFKNETEIQDILCLPRGIRWRPDSRSAGSCGEFPRCRASPVLHGLASCCNRISAQAPAHW